MDVVFEDPLMSLRRGRPVAAIAGAATCLVAQVGALQADERARSDVQAIVGHYDVSDGFSDRTFQTIWADTWLASGLGAHAEVHHMDREENATFFAGGLSYNSPSFSLHGSLGTSTNNLNILPEFYARLEATFRSSPETGWVLMPAVTHREYANSANETALQGQVLKYLPVGPTTFLILQGLVRGTWVDPGDHFASSLGGGITFADYRRYSIGVTVEGGRAAYDATFGLGSVDEPYIAVRPALGIYLTDKIELVAQGEYTDRDSYRVLGGHLGLKFYLD